MKLSGKNFQPWEDFELDIEKLTVIVGPSNKGKSALFRALKGVLRNELPAEFVRIGQDEPMTIEAEVDGHTIKATRSRKGSAKYVVDGKDYAKLAGGIPDVVRDMHFGEVNIGDFSVDPIFSRQNSNQFLIDPVQYKPTEINAILGAFANTEKLDAGKKEANLRISQKNSEAKTLASEIRDSEARKDILTPLAAEAIALAAEVSRLENEIGSVEARLTWVDASLQIRRKLTPLRELLDYVEVPDLAEVIRTYQQTRYLRQACSSAERHRELCLNREAVEQVSEGWQEVTLLFRKTRAVEDVAEQVTAKETSSSTVVLKRLETISTAVEEDFNEAVRLQHSIKYLSQGLSFWLQHEQTKDELNRIERSQSGAQELVSTLMELKNFEAQAQGLCPRCGKSLEHSCH